MNSQEYKKTTDPIIIHGETGIAEKGALACDVFMLIIFLWNQLRYGMNMLYLIIPLVFIGLYLVLFYLKPEEYYFTNEAVEIHHKWRKTRFIPYDSVFNIDSSVHDSFINLLQNNWVKLYHLKNDKKALTICKPHDVETFVSIIKDRCPEFCEEDTEKSRLEVFFNK